MMKVKYYKCPTCNRKFKTLSGFGDHVKMTHPEEIPEGWSVSKYFYFTITGRTHGICRTCKSKTLWNEASQKYNQYCDDPACKQAYAKTAKNRMIGKHGKIHLLNDPEMQRKMMLAKSTSGEVTFQNGVKIPYVSTYEKNFLEMLDALYEWDTSDIMAPSPHNYYYNYVNEVDRDNEGVKFYIPDVYIPSLNLEIEIKQTTSTHPKIIAIDLVKEKLKDELMKSNPKVNYLKVTDNDFKIFHQYLENLRSSIPSDKELESDIIDGK